MTEHTPQRPNLAQRLRLQNLKRLRLADLERLRLGRRHILALLTGILLGITGGLVWDYRPTVDHVPADSPLMAYPQCGEQLTPDPAITPSIELFSTAFGTPIRDRRVELRSQRHPVHGPIVWAEVVASTSDLDRVWLDWSYVRDAEDHSLWQDCAQPITMGRATPALKVFDDRGRSRWFRACGQVPPQDRGARPSGSYCTEWGRPF
ncbi:hypothetical protein [Nocardia huaxiensis]|uniref:Uncharacterized protein n=1 Tax=Nocardia huaxiensis TaxID=2755382 RepID=A0A7D6ZLW2_9NOCA|nr:hypothetical protein [Nocardia huaxiensis]QLY33727.1 hypothetical protein H0264_17140 [Nocardia huaxiensis]UFS99350.1 hypothetical protein LPY97_16380 [Nocardia huaxiensis]